MGKALVALIVFFRSTIALSCGFDNVSLVKVIDGDTIKVNIPYVHQILGENMNIRIRGIDAPTILEGAKIKLKDCERGKYFRLVCDVQYNKMDLAEYLLEERLAAKYGEDGKWCQ
jgi:endonuclease YncB( thermonuclease family)